MIDGQILAFAGIAALLTITPGADTMLVIRSVLARGQKAGLATVAGIVSGLFVHASLSALGLSLILVRSAELFAAVKLVGAGYLIFLGGQSLWQAWRQRRHRAGLLSEGATVSPPARVHSSGRAYREGLLSNVLNPKVALFYLAFLPQFIGPGENALGKSLLLALIHALLTLGWLSALTLFLGRAKKLLSRPGFQRGLESVTGTILIGFGVGLALERR